MDIPQILSLFQVPADAFSPGDIVFTIILSFVLSVVIAWVYKTSYRGLSYSQSYVHTLIIVTVVVSVIMLIIGSNIARAFTLVGALSVVRFRNAIKDTRDVGYIFFAMAIGMATGTRFYLVAIISTLLICLILWGMAEFDWFRRDDRDQTLRIRIPPDQRHEGLFDDIFHKFLVRSSMVQIETVQAGTLLEIVYEVGFRKGANAQDFVEGLRERNGNNKVVLSTGFHETDI